MKSYVMNALKINNLGKKLFCFN